MTIETKFSIGDEIHFIHDNKYKSRRVEDIRIFISKTSVDVEYFVLGCGWLSSKEVFPTKEELLKSL